MEMRNKLSAERYQNFIVTASVITMMFMMFLFAVIFSIAPNQVVFQRLREIHIEIPPSGFTLMCLAGMVVYPILLHPRLRIAAQELQHEIFMCCSAGVLLYFLPLAWDAFQARRLSTATIVYFGVFLLIVMLGAALYWRYHWILEIGASIVTAVLLVLTGIGFLFMPNSALFNRLNADFGLNLYPNTFAILSILGALGYLVLPFFKQRLTCEQMRFTFIFLFSTIALYGFVTFYNIVRNGTGSWVVPVAALELFMLVGLIGCALYRDHALLPRPAGRIHASV